jgi:hypothetical protein
MFRSIVLRRILSAVSQYLPLREWLGPVSTIIFIVIVAMSSIALLPEEDVIDTWFPTLESMWNNLP